jgi:KDO2-lipid IV(A) lauroyltransferase
MIQHAIPASKAESEPADAEAGSLQSRESTKLTRWERFSFWTAHTTAAGLLAILGLRGLYLFSRAFGTAEWLVNYKRRRRFARALERVLGASPEAAQRRRFTREHFQQTRCDKMLYLVFDCIPRDKARELFSIQGRELLEEAIAHGRGVYVATSHHSSIHIAGLFMATSGYKVAGVRERHESGLRRYVQDRLDRKHPDFLRAKIIFHDSFPREIFRCLQQGYCLASSMDVHRLFHPHQRTEPVVIFGESRSFLSGPLRIALRCQAPALQAFLVPERDFRYRLEIVGVLIPAGGAGEEDATVSRAMRQYAECVERFVRKSPHLMSRI